MRKTIIPFILACTTIAMVPVLKAGSKNAALPTRIIPNDSLTENNTNNEGAASYKVAAASLYEKMELGALGLSYEVMEYAYKGYEKLLKKGQVRNSDILTICDFSKSSDKKRMFILDLKSGRVVLNTFVAHGRNSGLQYAEKFSNTPESLQSSLGFYVTKATYSGKHGLSLRLEGKEKGINCKAEERAIVVHGAAYIGAHRLGSPYMGRSFGCPAVPQELSGKVINTIKDGSVLFIFHPSKSYLHGSKILNG